MGRLLTLSISFIALLCPAALAHQDSVFVTISGDTVKVWNTDVRANCAVRFEVSVVLSNANTITITERDTVVSKARCLCTFDLFVVLPGITHAGSYYVEVYRQYLKQFGYTVDTTEFIGSARFTIGTQASAQIAERFYQSNCHDIPNAEEAAAQVPSRIWLYQSYPNPFNPSTTITYQLPRMLHVSLSVYDMLGREVSVLVNKRMNAGVHEVRFDAAGLSSGVYCYRLNAEDFVSTKRMVIIK
jgi:hypothetical protein